MRLEGRGTGVSAARASLLVFCVLLLSSTSALAESGKDSPRLVCGEEFATKRRTELADKLRQITGWHKLSFDSNGALTPGTAEPVGGSQTARDLIAKTLSGSTVVFLEDASRRVDIMFARVVRAHWVKDNHPQPSAYVVLIDFADFQMVLGDAMARDAFNVGWAVLHEIDHAINDTADAESADEAGECENHINAMRREINLPERAGYYSTYYPIANDSAFAARFARLAFDRADKTTGKKKRYWLVWDTLLVGNGQSQIALR
jgi:hypothetical protein